jgi:hypothetical protein
MTFDEWIDTLEEDVVQGEYGYEQGEFTVYPEHWRALFDEGLTPSQAFDRALKAASDARKDREREAAERWERIQAADRAALSRT